MFKDNAVLILGAGASAPYGFPIGEQLISNISTGLARVSNKQLFNGISLADHSFLNDPCLAACCAAHAQRPTWLNPAFFTNGFSAWQELGKRLQHDPCLSIDEFARANPSQSGAVKLLVAADIAAKTYDRSDLENGKLNPGVGLTSNARSNWYGRLIAQLRRHFRDGSAFDRDRPLTVITFNYDRSLELFLEHEMTRAEKYKNVKWDDVVNVIHIHGEVRCDVAHDGRSPKVHLAEGVLASAEKMLVVDDKRGRQDPAKAAVSALNSADHIVALGFDFHEQNVNLLEMKGWSYPAKIRALNYAGSPGFRRKALAAGLHDENIWARQQSYSISDAIDHGIFEG